MKNCLLAAAACTLALFQPNVLADSDGLFIGAAGLYGQVDDDFSFEDEDDLEAFFDDSSVGFNGGVGWRFNKWLSVDAGYWDFGEFKSDRLGNDEKAEIETTTWTVGGMLSVPLWILDVYARGGVAIWDADSSDFEDDGEDPYYGVGAALNIFGSVDLYAEVIRFDLQTDLDTASLGIRITF